MAIVDPFDKQPPQIGAGGIIDPFESSGIVDPFDASLSKGEVPEEDSYLEVIGKGAMQGALAIPKIVSEGGHMIRKALDMPESGFRKDYVKPAEKYWEPKVSSKGKQYAGQATRSIAEMATTGAVGRGKAVLALLAGRAGAEKGAEALDEGYSMGTAVTAAGAQAATEYLTEKIPVGLLLAPGKKFITRLAQGVIADIPGELLATYTEMKGIDEQLLGKKYTDEQLWQALIDTAAVAGLTTVGATTLVQPLHALQEKSQPEPTPAPQQEIIDPYEGAEVAPDAVDTLPADEAPTLDELATEFGEELPEAELVVEPRTVEYEGRTPTGDGDSSPRLLYTKAQKGEKKKPLEVGSIFKEAQAPEAEKFSIDDVQSFADIVTNKWTNKPEIKTVQNIDELPPHLGKYIAASKGEGKVEGLFDPKSQSVYLIADNISSTEKIVDVVFHETLGHYGLSGTLGSEIKPVLNEAYRKYRKEADAIAEEYGIDTKTAQGKQEAAEEVLARMAQNGTDPTLIQKVIAVIRKWLKKMGLNVKLSDNDVKNMIADAVKFVKEGEGKKVAKKRKAVKSTPTEKVDEAPLFSRAPRPEGRAGKVYDDLKEARETSLEKKKRTLKQTFRGLKTSLVDVSGNVKSALNKLGPEGKKAVMRHIAHGGAHSKALRMTDKIEKEIYGKLTEAQHDYLDQYIYAKRHIEIASYKPDFKMPGGATKADMQALIDAIPSETITEIKKRAEVYWKTMDEQLQELKDNGLLTDKQLAGLRKVGRYYSPRVVLDYIDPMTTAFEGGKTITVPDSGIKKLSEEGTEKLVESDSSLLLSQVINRTQSRIFKNRANQALWDLAENQPDNGMVRKAKIIKTTKDGKPVFQTAPRGWAKISVMVDGKHKELIMPEEFASEWIFKDPILLQSQAQAIQWLSGTKILKPMATGLNPEFAFTNIPRDIALIWMSTEEYSPYLPKAIGQMAIDMAQILPSATGVHPAKGVQSVLAGGDLKAVLEATFNREGPYDDYINEGGGMEWMTLQGRLTSKLKGKAGQIQSVMGYTGTTSEIMTRLALRRRAIKNGATPEQATIIARNYLDFTQGGNLAKAADSALPYLNAGIQATRGIARAGITNPKLLTAKVVQVGGIATMLYLANSLLNPDAWDEIPDRDKTNNWIITTPYSYLDKTGTKRHIYFKIAKDQGQRVFASIAEAAAAKSIGDEVNADQVTMAAKDFIPFSPTNLPPTVEAILGYSANKDFWFNEDIWRGPKVKPEEEYTKYTPEAFKKAGKATGMSPVRLKSALQQYFTYGNIWTSLVGGGTQAVLKGLDDKDKNLVTEEVILKKPFIRKIVRSTDPYYKYGKDIEKADVEARTERHIVTRDFDNYTQKYFDGDVSKKDVKKYVLTQPPIERRRLMRRFMTHERLKDIPERKFWVDLLYSSPKARAQIYWGRWKLSDTKERKELEKMRDKVPGFKGKMFFYHLNKLKSGEVK